MGLGSVLGGDFRPVSCKTVSPPLEPLFGEVTGLGRVWGGDLEGRPWTEPSLLLPGNLGALELGEGLDLGSVAGRDPGDLVSDGTVDPLGREEDDFGSDSLGSLGGASPFLAPPAAKASFGEALSSSRPF